MLCFSIASASPFTVQGFLKRISYVGKRPRSGFELSGLCALDTKITSRNLDTGILRYWEPDMWFKTTQLKCSVVNAVVHIATDTLETRVQMEKHLVNVQKTSNFFKERPELIKHSEPVYSTSHVSAFHLFATQINKYLPVVSFNVFVN